MVTIQLKYAEFASHLEYGKKQLLTVVALFLTGLRHL